jgi:hypothetical protein
MTDYESAMGAVRACLATGLAGSLVGVLTDNVYVSLGLGLGAIASSMPFPAFKFPPFDCAPHAHRRFRTT